MLMLLSPAKTLDFDSASPSDSYTGADFLDSASELVEVMKTYTSEKLGRLMSVSDKIATLNAHRFKNWERPFTMQNAKQAVFAFKGDVYTGLSVETTG